MAWICTYARLSLECVGLYLCAFVAQMHEPACFALRLLECMDLYVRAHVS